MKKRKLKACLLLAMIPILLLALYIILDLPFLSTEAEYRLAEKAAMVGPGDILGISTVKLNSPNARYKVVAARSENAVFLYDGELHCRKDLGEPAILIVGSEHNFTKNAYSPSLPLILFDEFPEAVRAEIEIEIIHGMAGSSQIGSKIQLDANREHDGFFLFTLRSSDSVLASLSQFSHGGGMHPLTRSIPVELRLYDKDGKLLTGGSLELLSPGIIAHREQDDYESRHGIGG